MLMRCLSVRLSVCLSVTFVDHVKTNKHIFEIFSPSRSHTILVFRYQTGWRYSDGNSRNGDVEYRWGIGTNRDSGLIEDCWTCEVPKTFTDDEAQSFLLMIQRNGTMFSEILRHQQALWVSTQTGIKRSKILELKMLQEQSILTIKQ